MEASPLTQQVRPNSFQPKIARLYEDLFKQDDEEVADSDGFWGEFFLLKPDNAELERQLGRLRPDDLLNLQHETQQLFMRAVYQMKAGKAPLDEHALDVCRPLFSQAPKWTLTISDLDSLLRGSLDQTLHESKLRYHYSLGWP